MDKEAFIKALMGLRTLKSLSRKIPSKLRRTSTRAVIKSAPDKAPEWFKKSLVNIKDPDRHWKAYKSQSIKAGDESLLLWPLKALATKAAPKKYRTQAESFMWNAIGAPALRADMAVGRILEKTPLIGKKLFRVKEEVPWGKGLKKEVERSSALAPLAKARDIAEPILVGVGLEKGIKKLKDYKSQGQDMDDQKLRTKVASVMLHLHKENKGHEKRAHALRLLYKQAELGITSLPSSYSELEEKLAALANEDLVVLEKALELSGGTLKIGELSRKDTSIATNPEEKFQATILGNEL